MVDIIPSFVGFMTSQSPGQIMMTNPFFWLSTSSDAPDIKYRTILSLVIASILKHADQTTRILRPLRSRKGRSWIAPVRRAAYSSRENQADATIRPPLPMPLGENDSLRTTRTWFSIRRAALAASKSSHRKKANRSARLCGTSSAQKPHPGIIESMASSIARSASWTVSGVSLDSGKASRTPWISSLIIVRSLKESRRSSRARIRSASWSSDPDSPEALSSGSFSGGASESRCSSCCC
mmetsp:Transcript_3694/g.9669  ORF Transcript_3694/g.9669 Transcript_3694/m.9669 type:complete len:238 (-) Transcript_3694:227-940(-)